MNAETVKRHEPAAYRIMTEDNVLEQHLDLQENGAYFLKPHRVDILRRPEA